MKLPPSARLASIQANALLLALEAEYRVPYLGVVEAKVFSDSLPEV